MVKYYTIIILFLNLSCNNKTASCDNFFDNKLKFNLFKIDKVSSDILKKINPVSKVFTIQKSSGNYFIAMYNSVLTTLLIKDNSEIIINSVFKMPENFQLYKLYQDFIFYNKEMKKGYYINDITSPKISFRDSFDVEKMTDKKDIYVIESNSTQLLKHGDQVTFIYNYGINEQENINYLDLNSLIYSISDKNKKVGIYPKGFVKGFLPKRNTFFSLDTNKSMYLIRSYSDSIYRIDYEGNILTRGSLSKCNQFRKYTNKDLTDLIYLRKYIAENDQNLAIDIINNKNIVVLRKNAQKKVTDSVTYQVIILDMNLNLLHRQMMPFNIIPTIFPLGNNIIFFSTKLDELYIYEIN